ncbi:MAG TPA: mechanosensitive ion channel family protein [Propionibacteriaceae bacterium]|nr:mechanosensitive ion channel family protein [Propionibacteriaceae bacterium]
MNLPTWVTTSQLVSVLLVVVVTLVTRFLLIRLVHRMTTHALERAKKRRERGPSRADQIWESVVMVDDERFEQRTTTLGSVGSSIISITLFIIALLTIMAIFGVPLAPLLTSAGVGGVALAFGAQSLVKDFLSGMFMLMEDQYGVGDLIDTGEVTGTVEEFGLRVTRLRDVSGTIWYVRNGEIMRLGNQSQGWSTAIVDIPVAYNEDPDRAIADLRSRGGRLVSLNPMRATLEDYFVRQVTAQSAEPPAGRVVPEA